MLDFDSILPVRRMARGRETICRFLIRREEYEEFFAECTEYGIVWNSDEPLSAFDPFDGLEADWHWLELQLHNKTTVDDPDEARDRFTFTYDTLLTPLDGGGYLTFRYEDIPILNDNDCFGPIDITTIFPEFS